MADLTNKAELMAEINRLVDVEVPDNFEEVLRKVAKRKLTKEERRAQRISWLMSIVPRHLDMTREEVEEFVTERYG